MSLLLIFGSAIWWHGGSSEHDADELFVDIMFMISSVPHRLIAIPNITYKSQGGSP